MFQPSTPTAHLIQFAKIASRTAAWGRSAWLSVTLSTVKLSTVTWPAFTWSAFTLAAVALHCSGPVWSAHPIGSFSTPEGGQQDAGQQEGGQAVVSGSGQAEAVKDDFPDLAVAPDADRAGLEQIVLKAKTARPRTVDQYQDQQIAIREASLRLLEIIPADDPAYSQTEIDSIIASVSLMAFFEDDEQQDIVESLKEYLSGREPLTMQDVQTGVLAAGMIELQPDKKPAIELYEFLDRCLENDSREEMQSLRLNLQASLRRLNLLGSRFELEAVTIDGKKITADDLKGKYVIVDFFATWCAPCLAEAELIAFHYKKYADKGLAVIGISLDEGKQELQDYMDRKRLPWPIVHDADEDPLKRLAMKFGISALPTVLLLDKEGTVVSLEARQSELNRLMQILFEAPTPASELDQADQPADQPADQQPEIESRLEGIKK